MACLRRGSQEPAEPLKISTDGGILQHRLSYHQPLVTLWEKGNPEGKKIKENPTSHLAELECFSILK